MMQRFFIRRTLRYVCWFLVPVLCAFLLFGALTVRQESSSLRLQGESSLEALYNQLELVVNSVIVEQNQVANNSNMMVALKKILSAGDSISLSNAVYIRSLNTFLSSIVEAHSYISSIYLYFDDYSAYFSSDSQRRTITEDDESWLSIYREMADDADGLARVRQLSESVYADESQTQVLSVYRRMLIQKGVIVVNLNLTRLQESLSSMSFDTKELLCLFDEQGTLLSANTDTTLQESLLETSFESVRSSATLSEKGGWVRLGNTSYYLQLRSYELYRIYLVSYIARASLVDQLLPLFFLFFLFFLLVFAVSVGISYGTTRQNFREIEYILTLFEQAEQGVFPEKEGDSPKDEYGMILNNIIRLFLNTTYLNAELAKRQYRQQAMELSTLQYQINPHFLFNTLQTVDLEIRKLAGDTENISEILGNLSDILKYSLGNPAETVTLSEELRYLKEYVAIQQYRLSEEFIVYYEVEEEWMDFPVPRLLLQPLLENSILHGLRKSGRKGYVKVRVYPTGDKMRFVVIDNGVGMTREELSGLRQRIESEGSRNIGLTNVNRRLLLRYGRESTLKLQAKKECCTCISFKIPLDSPDILGKM